MFSYYEYKIYHMANNLKIARDIFNQRKGYRSYIIPPKSTDDNPLLLLPAKS